MLCCQSNVQITHTLGYVQAFYIDWAVLKLHKKCCIYFYIDWAVLKYCPINVKCLRINLLRVVVMMKFHEVKYLQFIAHIKFHTHYAE